MAYDLDRILSNLHIETLNEMQQKMLETYHGREDVVLLSPTGTGKTIAFLLPLLRSLDERKSGVQAVILVPSRELALQIESVFKSAGSGFRVMSCYGGRPAMDEHRMMKSLDPAVIVGTPGRMNDHLGKGNFVVDGVTKIVIDEFDKCLELGFQDEMAAVIGQLPELNSRILLSATDAEEIPEFTGLNRVCRLSFLEKRESAPAVNVWRVSSPEKDKMNTLLKLLLMLGNQSVMVFCNYRESVDRILKFLKSQKVTCAAFHGGMEQQDRERVLYKFRNGSCPVLISTDLAARGLDIPGIEHVVHYHLPLNREAYTHRNGRTARWDASGNVYFIVHAEESVPEYIEHCTELELPEKNARPEKPKWTTLYIGKGKKDKLNKTDVAGFLYKKGNLSKEDIGMIDVKDHCAYVAVRREKVRQVLALIAGEKIKGMKTLIEEAI